MDVSKILFSNQIYFQKFVEIIPISFQPVVVLEILLLRCWSFVSHRALWGYFEAPLSLSLSLSLQQSPYSWVSSDQLQQQITKSLKFGFLLETCLEFFVFFYPRKYELK